MQSQHLGAGSGTCAKSFAEANERLVARLRGATDEAAERHVPDGGWSAAQIGWHVATGHDAVRGLMSGDVGGRAAAAGGFPRADVAEIVAAIPPRLQAPAALAPPPGVRRGQAIAALEAAGMRMARALDSFTPERGARMGITSAVVGSITVYQIGEWAIAHIIRHNQQAKRVLGEG